VPSVSGSVVTKRKEAKAAVVFLLHGLEADPEVRTAVIEALGRIGDQRRERGPGKAQR
jgi:HEAT repeat protein